MFALRRENPVLQHHLDRGGRGAWVERGWLCFGSAATTMRVVQTRLGVVQYLVVSLLALLLAWFWHLQVLRHRHYRRLAEDNRIRVVPIAAPRGPLLDRHGRPLVENRPSFNLLLSSEQSQDLDDSLARLAQALGLGEAAIRERAARRRTPYDPVLVKADASLEEVTVLEARRFELPDRKGRLLVRKEAICIFPTLVWRPCRESLSPYWPFYMLTVGDARLYVRIDGAVFTALHGEPGI